MTKPSLDRIAAAAEQHLSAALNEGSDPEAIQAAIGTLKWARDNEETLRLAVQIMKDDYVLDVKEAFLGATIISARRSQQAQSAAGPAGAPVDEYGD